MVAVRQVIVLLDIHLRPQKDKRHLCVCPIKQRFLRINSNPFFPPHHQLAYADNKDILDHNSYVELRGLLRNRAYEISQAKLLGFMSLEECRKLVASVHNVDTLDDETKDFIEVQLC